MPVFLLAQSTIPLKKSRIGLYFTGGNRFADLTNDADDVQPQKILNLNNQVLNWGGGLYLGNLKSNVYSAIEVNLYSEKSYNQNQAGIIYSGSDFSALFNMVFWDKKFASVYSISGFTVSFLSRIDPNSFKGYSAMQGFEDSYYTTSVNYLVPLGIAYEQKLDLFNDEFNANDLNVGLRLMAYVPLTATNRFTDKGSNKINYPFFAVSLTLARVKTMLSVK